MKKPRFLEFKRKPANVADKDKLNTTVQGGLLGILPYVSINDFRVAELSGCREIIAYEDDILRVAVKGGVITVHGEGLTLRSYYGSEISVSGKITSVEREEAV